jgi:hypothetical protein
MNVNETGRYVQPGHIRDCLRIGRRDIFPDLGNLASGDSHVHHAVDPVFRIDNVAPFQQQIVSRLRGERSRQSNNEANGQSWRRRYRLLTRAVL